jgi:hypothetical protein
VIDLVIQYLLQIYLRFIVPAAEIYTTFSGDFFLRA